MVLPFLTATTHTLELETSAAVSVDYVVSYVDNDNTTPAFTPGSNQGNISTATTTTILSAPSSGVQRIPKLITIRNRDSSLVQTVVFKKDVSGVEYHITPVISLAAGHSLQWGTDRGLEVLDIDLRPIERQVFGHKLPSLQFSPYSYPSTAQGSSVTYSSNTVTAQFVGRAPKDLTSVTFGFRVTSAAISSMTWGEIGIYVGSIPTAYISQNIVRPIFCNGYLDAWNGGAGVFSGGAGPRQATISLTYPIYEGEDIWISFGQSGGSTNLSLAGAASDGLSSGLAFTALSNTLRPSTQIVSRVPNLYLWSASNNHVHLAPSW